MKRVKKVLFRAPVLTYSGYGVHSRQVLRYLLKLANAGKIDLIVEPTNWGNTAWAVEGSRFNGLVKACMKHVKPLVDSKGEPIKFDVSLQLILPNEWTNVAKFNVGITAAVESDVCNPEWVAACNNMDLVIVPSTHVETTLRNTGEIETPIHVIPESYFDELLEQPKISPFQFDTKFNFLMVAQLTSSHPDLDRKFLFGSLKHVCDAFANEKDVGIIVKTNSGRDHKIDRKVTYDRFSQLIKNVRKGDYPKFHLIHGGLTNHELNALYKHESVKAYLSFTRGEGFGLPILEAAVAGKPVITTDWSGHLDFMNKGRFIKIGYDLKMIPEEKADGKIWMKGSRWACPKERHIKEALKKFHVSPEIPTKWAQELCEKLRSEYSQEVIEQHYARLLDRHLM